MFGVPRKQKIPLSRTNIRGILLESVPASAYSSVIRGLLAPAMAKFVGSDQLGAKAKGGTEFVSFTARLFLQSAAQRNKSAGVIFIDLRRAFYSVLMELALGPLYTSHARKTVLQSLLFNDEQVSAFEQTLPQYLSQLMSPASRSWLG